MATLVLRRMNGVECFSEGIRKPSSHTCKEKVGWESTFEESGSIVFAKYISRD